MITKVTVVITKMAGDYEDHCGDNEMIGDCEDDYGVGCDAVQCWRSYEDTGGVTPLRGTCVQLQVTTRPG